MADPTRPRACRLWYRQPAGSFLEALPIGNGRIGGMVYGGVFHNTKFNDHVALNVDTLWWRSECDRHNPDALDGFREGRRLLMQGRVKEADHLLKMTMTSCPKEQPPFLPLGQMQFVFEDHYHNRALADYERDLDLASGVASVSYSLGGVRYRREFFVSAPGGVLAARFTADRPGALSFYTDLVRRPFSGPSRSVDGATIELSGSAGPAGVRYAARACIAVEGGACGTRGDFLWAHAADAVTILLAAHTDYYGQDPAALCARDLEQAGAHAYDSLRAAHTAEHAALFDRLRLDIEGSARAAGGADPAALPTDERLKRFSNEDDPVLLALVAQYGRYLLMASSRPGTLPANLQGIWNDNYAPPWESKYTININTEMNYWPAEPGNLSECHEPLFDHIDRMVANGRETARRTYGCRGFVAHNNLDGFADTAIVGEPDGAYLWPMGGAWLSLHLWERWQFTRDRTFLEHRAYPVLRECVEFFDDYLVEDDQGRLLTGPSLSPELSYLLPDGTPAAVCMAPAMDSQILHALLAAFLDASALLGRGDALVARAAEMKARVPQPQIGSHGRLLEWLHDPPENGNGHRHISHLFAVFPGSDIDPDKTPDLALAARRALERRIEHGGCRTGWSGVWGAAVWARLREGGQAVDLLRECLRAWFFPNLLGGHPPRIFQVDANFGFTAAVFEMLLQSRNEGSGFRVAASACAPQDSGCEASASLLRVKLLAPEGVHGTADADGASVSAADKSSSCRLIVPASRRDHQVIKLSADSPGQQAGSSSLLRLLPALPAAWPSGKVTGLRARGGFEVDMSWNDGRLTGAVIHSKSGLPCRVVCGDQVWEFKTSAGKSYPLTPAQGCPRGSVGKLETC